MFHVNLPSSSAQSLGVRLSSLKSKTVVVTCGWNMVLVKDYNVKNVESENETFGT